MGRGKNIYGTQVIPLDANWYSSAQCSYKMDIYSNPGLKMIIRGSDVNGTLGHTAR